MSDLHKNDLVFRSDLSGLKVVGRAQLDNRMKRLRNPVKVYRATDRKCTACPGQSVPATLRGITIRSVLRLRHKEPYNLMPAPTGQ